MPTTTHPCALLASLLLIALPTGCQARKTHVLPDPAPPPGDSSSAAAQRISPPDDTPKGPATARDPGTAKRRRGQAILACKSEVPRPDSTCKSHSKHECSTDRECKGAHAYCAPDLAVPSYDCLCQNGCVEDSDCAGNQLCYCDPRLPVGRCVKATCRSDADCGGRMCIKSNFPGIGCNEVGVAFHCQTPDDECTTSTDCPVDGGMSQTCAYEKGRHVCRRNEVMCGRPLLGASGPVLAVLRSGAWG